MFRSDDWDERLNVPLARPGGVYIGVPLDKLFMNDPDAGR